MNLSKEQIKRINKNCPNEWGENEQGVFIQPSGIPINEKKPVIYMRWRSSGMESGTYNDDDDAKYFEKKDLNLKF